MAGKKEKSIRKGKLHRRLSLAFGLLGGVLVLCLLAYVLRWRPQGVSLSVGDVVQEDITAPYSMEDGYLTELSRQKARQQVGEIYVSAADTVEALRQKLEGRFENLEAFLTDAAILWQQEAERFDGQYYYNSKNWQSMLTEQGLVDRLTAHGLTDLISTAVGYALLEEYVPVGQRIGNQSVDITPLKEAFYAVLEPLWQEGVTTENETAMRQKAIDAWKQTGLPAAVKTELAENIVKKYLTATAEVDEQATEEAREQAAQAVAPVLLEKGQVILSAGTVISQGDITHLKALGLLREGGTLWARLVSFCLYLLVCFGLYGLYLLLNCKRLLLSRKDMLSLTITLGIATGFSLLAGAYFPRWMPFLLVVLILGRKLEPTALYPTAVLAALVLCPLGADEGLFSQEAFACVLSGLMGGLGAVVLLILLSGKKALVPAAVAGSVLGALMQLLPGLYAGEEVLTLLSKLGCTFGGGALSLVLGGGLLLLGEKLVKSEEKTHD